MPALARLARILIVILLAIVILSALMSGQNSKGTGEETTTTGVEDRGVSTVRVEGVPYSWSAYEKYLIVVAMDEDGDIGWYRLRVYNAAAVELVAEVTIEDTPLNASLGFECLFEGEGFLGSDKVGVPRYRVVGVDWPLIFLFRECTSDGIVVVDVESGDVSGPWMVEGSILGVESGRLYSIAWSGSTGVVKVYSPQGELVDERLADLVTVSRFRGASLGYDNVALLSVVPNIDAGVFEVSLALVRGSYVEGYTFTVEPEGGVPSSYQSSLRVVALEDGLVGLWAWLDTSQPRSGWTALLIFYQSGGDPDYKVLELEHVPEAPAPLLLGVDESRVALIYEDPQGLVADIYTIHGDLENSLPLSGPGESVRIIQLKPNHAIVLHENGSLVQVEPGKATIIADLREVEGIGGVLGRIIILPLVLPLLPFIDSGDQPLIFMPTNDTIAVFDPREGNLTVTRVSSVNVEASHSSAINKGYFFKHISIL